MPGTANEYQPEAVGALMQDICTRISALIGEYDAELLPFVLVGLDLMSLSLQPLLSDNGRKIYEYMISHSETTLMPNLGDCNGT